MAARRSRTVGPLLHPVALDAKSLAHLETRLGFIYRQAWVGTPVGIPAPALATLGLTRSLYASRDPQREREYDARNQRTYALIADLANDAIVQILPMTGKAAFLGGSLRSAADMRHLKEPERPAGSRAIARVVDALSVAVVYLAGFDLIAGGSDVAQLVSRLPEGHRPAVMGWSDVHEPP